MCLLEDANAVQVSLMQVLQLLGSGQMDYKMAGLMLHGLQTASANMRNTQFEAENPTDVVIDRDDVNRTCINGPQWYEDDFEREGEADDDEAGDSEAEHGEAEHLEADHVEADHDDEIEDEADVESPVAAKQADAAAVPKQASKTEPAKSKAAKNDPAKNGRAKNGLAKKDAKHVSVAEARMKMQGVVRNWLLETVGEKAAGKPGQERSG